MIQSLNLFDVIPPRFSLAPSQFNSLPQGLNNRLPWATAALVQSIMLAGSVHAQSTGESAPAGDRKSTKLPEVTVETLQPVSASSPKYTEPLRDTPQTVIVIPSEVYKQQGAATLSDVLRNTPGITFAAGEAGGAASTSGDSFYMRGFDTSNNIFVDGVRDVGAYGRDVFNLEQVEVVKGPSGSDAGRGVSAGYVNLVTKTPRLQNFETGTLSYGFDEGTSNDRQRATLDVNHSLDTAPIKGTAFRLNAMWEDNGLVGRDYAANKGWAVAPSLALGLGTPTQATFEYQHAQQHNLPDYGLPTPAFPGYVTTPASPAIDPSTYYGFLSDYDRVINDAYTARLQHDFSPTMRLNNQTRYSEVERNAIVTTPGTSATAYDPILGLLTRSRQANKRDTSIFSNQTNFTAQLETGTIKHDLSAGAELSREKAYSPTFTSVTLTPIPLLASNPASLPSGVPFRSGAYTRVKTDTGALYAFDTIKFDEHWQINGGLRVDHFKTNYLSVAAVTGVPTTIHADGNLVTWKAGVVFKPATEGSLYAAYGVSEKPPGSDFTLSSAINNQNNPDTSPQKTESAETGVKWDFFKSRLSTTAALFQTENNKTVFTDPVLGAIPAGKQTVQGAEFNLSGKITEDWLVFGGFAYLHTKYDNGTPAQVGASLPLTPRVSGNLWTTYKFPFGLTIGGGGQYMGQANRLDTSTLAPRTMPSYWLINGVATYAFNPHVTFRFNVNNLANESYVQSYNNNGARFNPGAPRAYLLSADLSF